MERRILLARELFYSVSLKISGGVTAQEKRRRRRGEDTGWWGWRGALRLQEEEKEEECDCVITWLEKKEGEKKVGSDLLESRRSEGAAAALSYQPLWRKNARLGHHHRRARTHSHTRSQYAHPAQGNEPPARHAHLKLPCTQATPDAASTNRTPLRDQAPNRHQHLRLLVLVLPPPSEVTTIQRNHARGSVMDLAG